MTDHRIAFDVGGTFTDLCLQETATGRQRVHKVRSTPHNPAEGIERGVRDLLDQAGIDGTALHFIGHGTTQVTNRIIEGKGARLAIVTTEGFRDVLEIARQARPHLYDYRVTRPPPLARRADRFELRERLGADGAVVTALDRTGLDAIAAELRARRIEAVAVCFLHAYANPEHERAAAERLRALLPGVFVTASHEVAREFREFERFSTAAVNAFVGPAAAAYFDTLGAKLHALGAAVSYYTLSSNGGLLDEATARRAPALTALSGPSAGVVGAARWLAGLEVRDAVTFDVGGTSTDIAVITEGRPRYAPARAVAGRPILAQMVDIDVIGAGGGSFARVDATGALTVGPDSAGASPGPVAYDLGGQIPTLTDACAVLGRLPPAGLLGGGAPLNRAAARAAIAAQIAEPLGLSAEAAAEGIVQIAAANMSRAIGSAAARRGLDLRRFALAAFGGAGPLLACDVARRLGVRRIFAPTDPGAMCARSILTTDLTRDDVRIVARPLEGAGWTAITVAAQEMRAAGAAWLSGEAVAPADQRFETTIEARYVGQNFELPLRFEATPERADQVAEAFRAAHLQEQGVLFDDRAIEVMAVRLRSIGALTQSEADDRAEPPAAPEAPQEAMRGSRPVWASGAWRDTPVFSRRALGAGPVGAGPAVIEEMSATTWVAPGFTLSVVGDGSLILEDA